MIAEVAGAGMRNSQENFSNSFGVSQLGVRSGRH